MFVGILLRDSARDFGVEFESSRHHEIFECSHMIVVPRALHWFRLGHLVTLKRGCQGRDLITPLCAYLGYAS